MKRTIFKGCATALITPFTEDGVNLLEFERIVKDQIDNGVDALVVCGTTGEASTMTEEEKISVIKCALNASKGRVPIIVGTGLNSTKSVIEFNEKVEKLGVDGLLIVTPYYNKTTQEGLYEHYKMIAKNTCLPIILYNVPSRTGINILPETVLKLSKISNIVGIKEASGNISQVSEIASLVSDDFSIYSGNDDQILPILSLGGKGVISVVSHYNPKLIHDLCYKYFEGDFHSSKKIQLELISLIKILFSEVNPIPVKYLLNELGYSVGVPRLPLVEFSDKGKKELKSILNDYKKNKDN